MGAKLKFDYRRIYHVNYACKDYLYKTFKERSLLYWFYLYFRALISSLLLRDRWKYANVKDVLIVAITANNQRTLTPIVDKLKTQEYTYCINTNDLVPLGLSVWYSLPWLPSFLKLYFLSSKEEKIMIRKNGLDFLIMPGKFKVTKKFYEKNPNIKLVMFANDHLPHIRCLIEQANACGIKTFYTQHASVSNRFPPLSFSYSFLDGQETLDKYKECGPVWGKVILSGSSRFDVAMSLNKDANNIIGVAFNVLDDIHKVLDTCKYLRNNGFNNVVARPHPNQECIQDLMSLLEKENIQISRPSQENPFIFLSRIGFLVAGDSSIHLEAAMMNTPSVLYNWTDGEIMDNYKYHERGVMPYAKTTTELCDALKQRYIPSASLIQYYVASFGTSYHGKTSELIAGFINSLIENKQDEYLQFHFDTSLEGCYVLKGIKETNSNCI